MESDDRQDSQLIAASMSDTTEFELIFERHFESVHGYLARRAGKLVADELAADVFEAAFAGRSGYRPDRANALP